MKMKFARYICVLMSLAVCLKNSHCLTLDVSKFAAKIEELMNNNLGVRYVQEHYNKQEYGVTQLQGQILLEALKNALSAKVDKVRGILLEWKNVIEEDYASTTTPIGEDRDLELCCNYPHPTKFNYQFEQQVDMNGNCELSFNGDQKSRKFRRLNLKNMKEFTTNAYKRLENKGLYIYYGQTDGYYLQYPGMNQNTPGCNKFDARTRPWYVSAATQKSKDVVVLVDVSKNIDKTLFKEIVETFLKTLDPRDKIAVLPFAEYLFLHADHCFSSQLVSASPANRLAINNFVKSVIDKSSSGDSAHNTAMYSRAFEEAFKLFSNGSHNQGKLLFLITSGLNGDQETDVMRAIVNGNKKFSFKIVISAFAINPGMQDKKKKFHQDIVDQNCILYLPKECSNIQPTPLKGKFVHVTNEAELRNQVGSFYDFLSVEKANVKVRYSFPYVDFFGTGVLIAASIPTYKGADLMGVASIDLVVSELLSDVEYFKEGHNAYRFLIETSGLVYQHPLLPKPVLAFEPTVPADISLFEGRNEFASVRSSMISGGSSNKTLQTYRSVSRGDSSLEGALGVAKKYTYYWKPVPLTNLSLAVVIEATNADQYELKDGIRNASPMVYHRLDRIGRGSQYKFCRSFKYLVLKDQSVAKLPADAFGSPAKYYVQETTVVVADLMKYFSSNGKGSQDLLQSQTVANRLRKSIQVTSGLDAFWRNLSSPYVGWRYIATEDGVFRIFPGVEIHPLYDPRSRPWYQRSLIYPETTVISTPYFGSTLQSWIITFSSLIEKKVNHTRTTVAVMGLDFSMYNFKKFLLNNVNECRNKQFSHSCMVVEKSGLIIFDPDFTNSSLKQEVTGQHITLRAPDVAADLIKDKHLLRKACIGIYKTNKSSEIAEPHLQYFFVLDVDKTVSKVPNALNQCPEYSLVPVPKTNVYVLIIKKSCMRTTTCTCPADGKCKMPLSSFPCHCPCKHFLTCDEYLEQVSTILVCPPPPTNLLIPVKTKEEAEKEEKEAMTYARCRDPNCKSITTWDNCDSVGCQWCFADSNGDPLPAKQQFCGYSEECPRGKKLPTKGSPEDDSDDTNTLAIVLPIVFILILVMIVILLIILHRKGRLPWKSHSKRGNGKNGIDRPAEPQVEMNFSKHNPNEVAI